MELVYGVLRQRGYLDWLLAPFLKKPAKLPPETMDNLRVALYQLLFTRVPEWAAVDEAVNIEKQLGGKAELVNAVLRNYLRKGEKTPRPLSGDPAKKMAVLTSHPEWLVRRWISRLGRKEAEELARANNEIPPLTLRAEGDRDNALTLLTGSGIDAAATRYSPSGILIKGRKRDTGGDGAVTDKKMEDGRRITPGNLPLDPASFFIQDQAAQLVTWLLDPGPGERVLDACAAPGGKTTHIASLMKDRGEVIATEIDPERAGMIRENVVRLGLKSVHIETGDIREGCVKGMFDRVLLDAPCSSIGVIRRNPDVKYRHKEADLGRFGTVQLGLLRKLAVHVKKGGTMVYSVCSTEPEEGEEIICSFLQACPDFSIIEGAYEFLKPFSFKDRHGHIFYRTWPHKTGSEHGNRYGMDGFFAARLKKT
jgi:16S rRNA (cytosine967-C5)-methyltransferase